MSTFIKTFFDTSFQMQLLETNIIYTLFFSRDLDVFDYKYIEHCVKEGRLLPNLIDYRTNKRSIYLDYDPFRVLLGIEKWSEVPRKPEGTKVPDFDFDPEEIRRDNDNTYKNFKSAKMGYSRKEQREIIQFLMDNKAYKLTGGNTIWKRMEHRDCCHGNRYMQATKRSK